MIIRPFYSEGEKGWNGQASDSLSSQHFIGSEPVRGTNKQS